MKKITGKRIFIFIILVFVALNISWFLITTIKYNKFVKAVPKDRDGVHSLLKDGYNYHVKKPDYLHYTGNLAISTRSASNRGELLIIWPLISGGYEYGFSIQEDNEAYELYVDKNMKPIDTTDTYVIQKFEEHKAGLEQLFSKADEMWQLK
ncbi:hypothetical protein CPAST_c24900 [Clostridium pasteurianum DSM 525 = ATCC 6013]|uniref:Uncharacterized protein n=1 Tax=Clostridium pasteurianum DSM 525 = ATCC 6013 TaxID=1262449 RepID=A0A0H3J4X6_CLOPA|nr:hypothetical protein [Clostridium pasteurianum]AJA48559.1 hypothetical protein CPAST_c24900 [Clostridium pasteurianum DSM 525 = ATCC 6013]AJA52547.1 hypothetical protein CLPA_c24900 [Clostridium pasteurianum DSM 525 = ATCC 6013]AOZ75791.1 hypothetical protein AQ983_12095 [Clostridium pasteurianum DSM 525 = ATCC 6013]AOZ79587.1 hypothetical protein AQ984_12090 [Clostridium pasteurianum]ELP57962.1 hypothetical protein F502_17215 [Clostridium pasteurianum DSM 525 = ATCC 6013]